MFRFIPAAILIALIILTARSQAEVRTWKDKTGAFSVEAEYVTADESAVVLKTKEGRQITVPLARLSFSDRVYIKAKATKATTKTERDAAERSTREGAPLRGGTSLVGRRQIEAAMKQPATFEFVDRPLSEVIGYLEKSHRLQIVVDHSALDVEGLDTKTTMTATATNQPLDAVLTEALAAEQLTWLIRDEVVFITTNESAASWIEARVYRLIKPVELDALVNDIVTKVQPDSWESRGGPGVIAQLPGVLVVAQTPAVQNELAKNYAAILRPLETPESKAKPKRGSPAAALRQATVVEFIETPLSDVASFISNVHGIPVKVDEAALNAIGLAATVPISANLKGVQLQSALNLLLSPLDLTWTTTDREIVITSVEVLETKPQEVTHATADIVLALMGNSTPLESLITKVVAPDSWDAVGGRGTMVADAQGNLVVTQTLHVHQQINDLLMTLRQ